LFCGWLPQAKTVSFAPATRGARTVKGIIYCAVTHEQGIPDRSHDLLIKQFRKKIQIKIRILVDKGKKE